MFHKSPATMLHVRKLQRTKTFLPATKSPRCVTPSFNRTLVKNASTVFVVVTLAVHLLQMSRNMPLADDIMEGHGSSTKKSVASLYSGHASHTRSLVIGAAGFIGMHTTLGLLNDDDVDVVIGLDNMNAKSPYRTALKEARLASLQRNSVDHGAGKKLKMVRGDACDEEMVRQLMLEHDIDTVFYLASQKYDRSEENIVKRPFHYPINNVDCLVTVLEVIRAYQDQQIRDSRGDTTSQSNVKLIYASAAVEGTATSNEVIAMSYRNLYNITSTALRFNETTVVGLFANPSSQYFSLASNLIRDKMLEQGAVSSTDTTIQMTSIDDTVRQILEASTRTSSQIDEAVAISGQSVVQDDLVDWIEAALVKGKVENTEMIHKNANSAPSIEESVAAFVQWFLSSENGQQYTFPRDSETLLLPTQPSSLPRNELCFVTAMFTDNATKSDPIKDITDYDHERPFRYFFFTNHEGLQSPGWERVIISDFPFERMITQSRWPKFMGWMHPALQGCQVVIYTDAIVPPLKKSLRTWKGLALNALQSPNGLYQRENLMVKKRHSTIFKELDRIVTNRKDTEEHVEQSKAWFSKQDGFVDDVPGFYNMFLIYDPTNEKFQELMSSFWAAYSSEEMSWRDQPLYRHVVNKLQIYPSTSGKNKLRTYFPVTKTTAKAHQYVEN
jgi:nucleoside-diphosphate-sugar epimerase